MDNTTPNYSSEAEAADAIYNQLQEEDEECIDNYRFAFCDDAGAMAEYELAQESGCCGSADFEVTINGRKANIGYNFGH